MIVRWPGGSRGRCTGKGPRSASPTAAPRASGACCPLAESLGTTLVARCDVRSDEDIAALMARARETFGTLDIIIHAPAAANPAELRGPYLDTTREGFMLALDVGAYSLTAIVRRRRGC